MAEKSTTRPLTLAGLMIEKINKANWYERLVNRIAAEARQYYINKHPDADMSSITAMISERPDWKAAVGGQQFANREAQMYGLGAILNQLERMEVRQAADAAAIIGLLRDIAEK